MLEVIMKSKPEKPWHEQSPEVEVLDSSGSDEAAVLVVYNDDFNTFDHVINTLMKVCGHAQEQAEQCTFLIHHKGKCKVKEGSYESLVPMRQAICDRGISAEVE